MKSFRTLAFLSFALVLAACSSELSAPNTRKEPIVTEIQSLHAVRFDDGGYKLTHREAESLLIFLGDIRPEQGDIVNVEYPIGAVPGDVTSRRAELVSKFLAKYDIHNAYFQMPERATNAVRVSLSRVAVNAPAECPDWEKESFGDSFVNGLSPNHGCAHAANLASMIANPRDLLPKTEQGTYYGERVGLALTRYRQDQVKQSNIITTTGGQ